MVVVDIQIAKQLKTNHEMANIYILKHKMIGRLPNIALNFLPNDRVELVKVLNTRDNGKIIIPSFVTDIRFDDSMPALNGPFMDTRYEHIFIDNQPDIPFDASGLCANMKSNSLEIRFKHPECVTGLDYLFYNSMLLQNISGIENLVTSNIKSIKYMFGACHSLQKISDLSNWDTSQICDITGLFTHCVKLSELPNMSGWKTPNLIRLNNLCCHCQSLKQIDALSSLNVSKVRNFKDIFLGCKDLENLSGIENWDTKSMRSLAGAF